MPGPLEMVLPRPEPTTLLDEPGLELDTVLSAYADEIEQNSGAVASIQPHLARTDNPHGVTQAQVGLGAVDNTSDVDKPISAQTQIALSSKAPLHSPSFSGTVMGISAAMVGAPSGAGSSTGTNTGDETAGRVGSLISNAEAKVSLADTDVLAIADPGAGGVLRRFSWENVKAALAAIYVRLVGAAGGQTLTGGTGPGETLALQSTAHATRGKICFGQVSCYDEQVVRLGIGTTSPSAAVHVVSTAEHVRVAYDAAAYTSASVGPGGDLTITPTGGSVRVRSSRSTATLGSELVTNGSFASDLGSWTDSGASWSCSGGAALHTPGTASSLSQNVTVASGTTYEVSVVMSRTAGSCSIAIGSVSVISAGASASFASSANRTVVAAGSGSVTLAITPTVDFAGMIDSISVRPVTLGSVTPAIVLLDASGAVTCEMRAPTGASLNTGFGAMVHRSIVSGTSNTGVGSSAQLGLTDGASNAAFGAQAQFSITTGSSNAGGGRSAQYFLATGYENSAWGFYAQGYLVSGYANAALGARAACFLADGTTCNRLFLGTSC